MQLFQRVGASFLVAVLCLLPLWTYFFIDQLFFGEAGERPRSFSAVILIFFAIAQIKAAHVFCMLMSLVWQKPCRSI